MYYYKPDIKAILLQHISEHSVTSNGIVEVKLRNGTIQKFDVKNKTSIKAYEKKPESDSFTEISDFPEENLELIAKEFDHMFRRKHMRKGKI